VAVHLEWVVVLAGLVGLGSEEEVVHRWGCPVGLDSVVAAEALLAGELDWV
jgi:hypothetical protein